MAMASPRVGVAGSRSLTPRWRGRDAAGSISLTGSPPGTPRRTPRLLVPWGLGGSTVPVGLPDQSGPERQGTLGEWSQAMVIRIKR